MISLYLHIGTEKTGSSYLQSVAAINREYLQASGIWFPFAGKREWQLLQGQISAGNAQPLTDAVKANASDIIVKILKGHLATAQARKCQSVLLSNELMMLALSEDKKVAFFQELVYKAGFSKANYLLVLRDPVDQALSLFKHRAKSGTAPEIEHWADVQYHYGTGLSNFLQQVSTNDLTLSCQHYDNHLDNLFFRDWLGLESSQLSKPEKRVNPSLSISELLFIRQVRQQNPILPKFLYNALLRIPKSQKAQEQHINNYYKSILNNALYKYNETWTICNQFLPEETPLKLPKQQAVVAEKVMTFSAEQVEVIADLMHQMRAPVFWIRLTLIRYKQKLGQLRNFIIRQLPLK